VTSAPSLYVVVGLLVLAGAVLFVLAPLLRARPVEATTEDVAAERRATRHSLYRQILEIEFDQQVGKVSDDDASELTAELLRQATGLLVEEPGQAREAAEARAQLEAEIAAVRRALATERRANLEPAAR
jgi:cytochrome c-type biogenesis protein CcmI